jgi:galactokinase
MPLDTIAERAAALFGRCFGHPPRWVVGAPGRVNLIGEHTDYNEGFVLPMAIERNVIIAGCPNKRGLVTLHSTATGETAQFKMRPQVVRGEPAWSNYVRGVVAAFQERHPKLPAFDALIESTLPYGGGLASSAALEVGIATLLEAMVGARLDPLEKAVLCQRAEREFAEVPCGIMDQFTSILGQENHALLLDCRTRAATPVPMTNPEVTVLIVNTHIRHRLAQSEYPKRRDECMAAGLVLKVPALRDATPESLEAARETLDAVVFRRARHVVTENARVLEMARAIQACDWLAVGKLMYASHASLRDDYEVSCRELDAVVEIAQGIGEAGGVIGCRMTGGGFGGCAVCLVKTEAVKRITRAMDAAFEKKTGHQAAIFSSRPAAGACVLRAP